MKRVVVDPVTRIEGHLRVEINVDETTGKVQDALSSGTAWRGIETILRGRDPRDAWAFTQRFCGVCTTVHALASVRAVEDALQIQVPKNANYIRNIMAASQATQDHLVHFYHLHALDWVSPVEALKADPAGTASIQNVILAKYNLGLSGPVEFDTDAYPKEFPRATPSFFKAVQDKVKKLVESGQLGIFAAHWWDHPDYKLLPPEVHLMAVSHYLTMLDRQRELVSSHVVFGGKNPHPQYIVGGMPCAISMNDMNAPVNTARLGVVDASVNLGISAVNYFYLPDLLAIGDLYVTQHKIVDGGGLAGKCVLGYGDFPEDTYSGIANGDYHKRLLVRCQGVVENFAAGVDSAKFTNLEGKDYVDPEIITENIEHSWYGYPQANKGLHPFNGVTDPHYTGPKEGTKTDWKYLDEHEKYSWIKTPMWRGKTAEVGPLARYIVVYVKVKQNLIQPTWAEKMIVEQIDAVSKVLGAPPHVWMVSTVGRTACRGLESQVMAYINKYFLDKLIKNIRNGDTATANMDKFERTTWPKETRGVGLHEAPRGALGHWIQIKDGLTANYQAVVPTTWNACPRDSKAGYGAYESSMIETRVKLADKPLEILKTIHSFDPCIACATHLFDMDGKKRSIIHSDPFIHLCGGCDK